MSFEGGKGGGGIMKRKERDSKGTESEKIGIKRMRVKVWIVEKREREVKDGARETMMETKVGQRNRWTKRQL